MKAFVKADSRRKQQRQQQQQLLKKIVIKFQVHGDLNMMNEIWKRTS